MEKLKKSDLKTGMKIKLRNGEIYTVIFGTEDGDVFICTIGNHTSLFKLSEFEHSFDSSNKKENDIMIVYRSPHVSINMLNVTCSILWKREE